jgi:hypothetical protein
MEQNFVKEFHVRIVKVFVADENLNLMGFKHEFAIQDESENYLDFMTFCLDVAKGVLNKTMKMYYLPDVHKSIDNKDVNLEHINEVMNKYIEIFIEMEAERMKVLNDLNEELGNDEL